MATTQKSATKRELLAKAAEYREIAKTALSSSTRNVLLKLAAEYEAQAAKLGAEPSAQKPDTAE